MSVDRALFGAAMKAARDLLGMSQADLANWYNVIHRTDMQAPAVSRVETARYGDNLALFQHALEMAGTIFLPGYQVTLRDKEQHSRILHAEIIVQTQEDASYPSGRRWTADVIEPRTVRNPPHPDRAMGTYLTSHLRWLDA